MSDVTVFFCVETRRHVGVVPKNNRKLPDARYLVGTRELLPRIVARLNSCLIMIVVLKLNCIFLITSQTGQQPRVNKT